MVYIQLVISGLNLTPEEVALFWLGTGGLLPLFIKIAIAATIPARATEPITIPTIAPALSPLLLCL